MYLLNNCPIKNLETKVPSQVRNEKIASIRQLTSFENLYT